MVRWTKICLFSIICALGCDSAKPELASEPSKQTDIGPFFVHTGSVDLIAEYPDAVGALTVDDVHNEKIVAFVEYLGSKNIRLRYHESSSQWRVVSPTFGDYAVRVESIRAFPDSSTLREMQIGCQVINLAHGLNPKAELIMSIPDLTRTNDDSEQTQGALTVEEFRKQTEEIRSRPDYTALVETLKQLFIEYEP